MMYIVWDVSPQIIPGWNTPNYYSLLFITGIILGFYTIKKMFKNEGVEEKVLDSLLIWMIISTIVGMRMGHVIFYGWDYYKNNLIEIFQVWKGGYASHGAAILILITMYFFANNVAKKPYLWVLDRIVTPIAIAGCFIRLGNLMNSEIAGTPTDLPWAFSFPNYINDQTGLADPSPRHPTQIYEAFGYLMVYLFMLFMYWKRKAYQREGLLFGIFMVALWGIRFFVEYVKEGQTERDFTSALNTGQWLSIPFIIIGIWLVIRALMNKPKMAEQGIQE